MKRLLLPGLAALLLAACGYHAPGAGDAWVGGEGRTVHLALLANRTAEPYLDTVTTEEIAMQLARSRRFELSEDRAAADLLLDGAVTGFASQARAYGADDRIRESSVTLTVKVRLVRRSDNAVLWQDDFRRSETYPALADKNLELEARTLAAREAARRIAEDLMSRLYLSF